MQVFKMLFENNVKRVLMTTNHFYSPTKSFCRVDDKIINVLYNVFTSNKIINVLYNVFTSNKNCVISIKDSRQSGETTNLLAYAGVYSLVHCDKTVFYIVDNEIVARLLSAHVYGENISFVTAQHFDFIIRGRSDVGLVIVDSQVSNVSDIIKRSHVLKDTQFVISTDESNIKFI